MNLENYNYYGDHRVKAGMTNQAFEVIKHSRGEGVVEFNEEIGEELYEKELIPFLDGPRYLAKVPMSWEVCGTCNGEGTVVDPNIDAGGLTQEDFYRDPDFAEDYFSGAYDMRCPTCKGRTTVPAPTLSKPVWKVVHAWQDEEAERVAERCWELRMGY